MEIELWLIDKQYIWSLYRDVSEDNNELRETRAQFPYPLRAAVYRNLQSVFGWSRFCIEIPESKHTFDICHDIEDCATVSHVITALPRVPRLNEILSNGHVVIRAATLVN